VRLIQLPALAGSGAFDFAAAGPRAGTLAGALAAGALAAGALAAGALAAGALAACVLGAAVARAVVVGLGVEAVLRTGAWTGFFFAGALAAGGAGIGFFMGALADIVKVVCLVEVIVGLMCLSSEQEYIIKALCEREDLGILMP
jgi:hypothetical protein